MYRLNKLGIAHELWCDTVLLHDGNLLKLSNTLDFFNMTVQVETWQCNDTVAGECQEKCIGKDMLFKCQTIRSLQIFNVNSLADPEDYNL